MALTGLDHLIVMGDDLDHLMQQYTELGFTVLPGGRHPWGTHNALICLADGSYIELLAYWGEPPDGHRHIAHVQQGGGLVEYMLASDAIEADISTAEANGIPFAPIEAGARTRPDGVEVAWKNGLCQWAPGLPHLIEDVTDRVLRVPDGDARIHANGITGTVRLVVGVAGLAKSVAAYRGLLGREETERTDERAVFAVGTQELVLQQPGAESEMAAQVERLGDSPFAVCFSGPEGYAIDAARAGGVRMQCLASV